MRLAAEAPLSRHTETELKLAVAPEHLAAVSDAAAVVGRRTGEPVTVSLDSAYFDTPDRLLSARRAVLRVRLTPDGFIQTLKSGDGLTRHEWEWPVTGPGPVLAVIVEPAARAVIDGLDGAALRPTFRTRVERTLHQIDGGAIELAVDRGEIIGPDADAREPISEVELELKTGESASLYRLALALAETVPLRVEPRTKAARGFALANREPPRAFKAQRQLFEDRTTVDSALAAILGGCFHQFALNEPCLLAGDDPEGVHQARVALRRLRSALGLFRDLIPAADRAWLAAETKALADTLGPARDWDVFLAELLAPVKAAFATHPDLHADLAALEAAALAERHQAYQRVRALFASPGHTRFQLRFGLWLESRGWRAQAVTRTSAQLFRPLRETADALLDRRHRKARKLGGSFAELADTERHQLRIAMKKLRYAADFFRSLYDARPVDRYLQRLATFQDALGHLNDVATAARLVPVLESGAAAARAVGVVIGWHGRGLAALEPRLVAEWRDFRSAGVFWTRPARHKPSPPREEAPS
ncbi:MAG: CHAD domain-containing protein [Rhodospirillaceae bacterium]